MPLKTILDPALLPEQRHTPILLEACLQGLNIQAGKGYVDGTLGMGGHSEGILKTLHEAGETTPQWLGIDQDAQALTLAQQRLDTTLNAFDNLTNIYFKQANYSLLSDVMASINLGDYCWI
jgi:16S rRNA (cytosine1402-N4)-methyltransferase